MIAILISQIHYLLFLLKPKEWKIKRKKKKPRALRFDGKSKDKKHWKKRWAFLIE